MKRNVVNKKRNSGEMYEKIMASKKIREARKMKPGCAENCRLKCTMKFLEKERKQLFTGYWSLGKLKLQRQYLGNSMKVIEPNIDMSE